MRDRPAVHCLRRRPVPLRSALLVCLVCALLLSVSSSFADPCVHYMDNVMPGDLLWEGRVQPTETEAGYSGDGYCPFCHALCEAGYAIPPLGGGDASGSGAPAEAPETAPPAPPTEQPPLATPTPTPEPVILPPDDPNPEPVPQTDQSVLPPSGSTESNTGPASHETLPPVYQKTESTENAPAVDKGGTSSDQNGGSSTNGSSGGGSGVSDTTPPAVATPSPKPPKGRDLIRFPIFSSRFPYRRLRLYVPPELRGTFRAEAVGILLWPLPESNDSSTPLNSLLGE